MMKSLMHVAAMVATVAVAPWAMAEEKDGVVEAFSGYKAAILAQKGEAAAGWVTKGTIDEYQRYLDWSLEGDRKTVEELSFLNRVQVLMIRHRVPAETLRAGTGKSIFVYAVDNDWIGKDGVIRMDLGEVTIAGERATAKAVVGGEPTPMNFEFRKEEGKWKLDLVALMALSGPALKAAATKSGMEENEFIFEVLEVISGTKPDESLWKPVGKNGEVPGDQ